MLQFQFTIVCLLQIILSITATNTGCQVPDGQSNLIVTDTRNRIIHPGALVQNDVLIRFSCDREYSLVGELRNFCIDNAWRFSFPVCQKFCTGGTIARGFSTEASRCLYQENQVNCTGSIRTGTVVHIRCAKGYVQPPDSTNFHSELRCKDDGTWDYEKGHCEMECGLIAMQRTAFVKGGQIVDITAVPWHVGIYSKHEGDNFTYICGGTIISANLVLTAAHCFWDRANSKTYNASIFAVGAGKYFKDFYSNDEYFDVQKRNVSRIILPKNYMDIEANYLSDIALLLLEAPLRYTHSISPICLEFRSHYLGVSFNETEVDTDIQGSVAGWGGAGRMFNVLQKVGMKTLSFRDCQKESSNYRLASDKFCISNQPACGLSGSGFFVEYYNSYRRRSYYRLVGVVSHSAVLVNCSTDKDGGISAVTNAQFFKDIIISQIEQEFTRDYIY